MKILKIFGWFIAAGISVVVLIASSVALTIIMLPKVTTIEGCLTTTMYQVDLCPTGGHYVRYTEISPSVIEAVVASEDTSFFSHNGFDWYEMEQSFRQNLSTMHIHRGGSTLTQQLAKNIWLSKEKSYFRKIKEAYLTYQLEKHFDKKFILEKYLNVVQFGPNLYGIKDAAQHYFHKSPSQLHLLEATYLAFLLPNPDVYSKNFGKGQLTPFGKKIISVILNRLATFKKITPGEYEFAKQQISNFPWNGLSIADFANAKSISGSPIEPLKENDQDLDKFYSEDSSVDATEPEAASVSAPEPVSATPPAPDEPDEKDTDD
jgi:monofunctional glycosyltransferase